jgi:hypothetical protein
MFAVGEAGAPVVQILIGIIICIAAAFLIWILKTSWTATRKAWQSINELHVAFFGQEETKTRKGIQPIPERLEDGDEAIGTLQEQMQELLNRTASNGGDTNAIGDIAKRNEDLSADTNTLLRAHIEHDNVVQGMIADFIGVELPAPPEVSSPPANCGGTA